MDNHSPIDSTKVFYIVLIAAAAAAALWFNYKYLREHVTTNSQTINEFEGIPEEEVRMPAVSGVFYPKEKEKLSSDVEHYLSTSFKEEGQQPKILIVPHAGYVYSATVAAKAYMQLKDFTDTIKTVILVGPSHNAAFNGVAVSSKSYFQTPIGKVAINRGLALEISHNRNFGFFDKAHEKEHSIEVQLPFLQRTLRKFSIVPLVYGNVEPEVIARVLQPYLNRKDTLIVFSADLSHYLDAETSDKIDEETAEMVENKDPHLEDHRSCGATGINAALIMAKENNLHPKLLDKLNSGDVMGDKTSVVGYASWMFINDEKEDKKEFTPLEKEVESLKSFAKAYGKDLMKLAYESVDEAVLHNHSISLSRSDYPNDLFNKGASFVTIEKDGELRGCIGTIVPYQSIGYDVSQNAYRAALEDDRFSPIEKSELRDLEISISLLSNFEEIKYEDEEDLVNKINAGIDGIIIRDGNRQALYLPSVWKQIPEKREFLNSLKVKAGMSPTYWSNNTKAYRFRTIEISIENN